MAVRNKILSKTNIRSLVKTLLSILVLVTLYFAIDYKSNTKLRGFEFQIAPVQDGRFLINKNEVKKLVEEQVGFDLSRATIDDLDLMAIENLLDSDTRVKDAEIYLTKSNRIAVTIQQRKPLYRVEAKNKVPYYVDAEGERISVRRSQQKVRVPIVTGRVHPYRPEFQQIKNHNLRKVHKFFKMTESDAFLRSFVPQLDIEKNGEFVLIAKMSGKRILLGDMSDLETKIEKLKKYCKEVGFDDFNELDLRYKDQILGRT